MKHLHRFDIAALVITAAFAFGAFTVSAQDALPTPTFSQSVLETQAALEAAIDALPVVATQSGTLVNAATPAPEVTEEAPANVVINIDNAAPVEQPTPQPEPTPDGDVTMNVWQVVIGVGTLLITGMAAGGFGVLAFLRGVNQNPALMASIEALANSRPDRERTTAYEIGKVLKEAGSAIEEATDNIPVASKGTTVNAPAGSTTVITTDAAFVDPRPVTTPSGSPLQPSVEDVQAFTQEGVG